MGEKRSLGSALHLVLTALDMQAERTLQLASLDDAAAAVPTVDHNMDERGLIAVDVLLNVFDCRARCTVLAFGSLSCPSSHAVVAATPAHLPHRHSDRQIDVCAFPPPARPPVAMAHLTVPFRVRLFFVRHGESQMNTAAHLLGQRDDTADSRAWA